MKIAYYYTGNSTYINELLKYDLTFLIDDDKYVMELLKYNKPIKKQTKEKYDIVVGESEKIKKYSANKKVVIGQKTGYSNRIYYMDKLDMEEILKPPEKKDYKFSIIVPNYNNGDWIDKTIESVLNQTHKEWEMYIIDDVSTDNSIEVIKRYQDERIHLIENEIKLYNGGSRNIGILKAKKSNPDGYLLFIDSDDWLANENVLEDLNNFIEDEDLITLEYQNLINNKLDTIGKQTYKNIDELFMTVGSFCAVWCKCFKTSVAPLFEFNTLMEDRNYHYRLVNRIRSYVNYEHVTHIWNRMNMKSVTRDKDQIYDSELQCKIEWDNCAYRHIAGMMDLLNEIEKPIWRTFIEDKIKKCRTKVENGVYEQF